MTGIQPPQIRLEWNDVPDGMGSEFGDGPLYYSESENCEIKGFTGLFKPAEGKSGVNAASGSGQNVTSVYHVTNDLRLGQMSSLILPMVLRTGERAVHTCRTSWKAG